MNKFVLLSLLFGFASDGAAETLTLESAVERAVSNPALVKEFEARSMKARAQQYRADYAWTPKVQTSFILAPVPGEAELDQFSSNIDQFLDFNFGPYLRNDTRVLMPVYTFGKLSTAQELAELGVDVAALQKEEALRDMEFQVKRAYRSYQLAQAFQALLDEGAELIKPKLAEMEEARDFGEGDFSTEDLRKLQIFDAEFDARGLDNQKLYSISSAGLVYLTRLEGEPLVAALPTESPSEVLTLKEAEELAFSNRPDLKMLARGVAARELLRQKAVNDFYPNIFVAARFGFGVSTENLALQEVCRRPTPSSECVDTADLFAKPYSNPLSFLTVDIALGLEWTFDFVQLDGKLDEADADLADIQAKQERAIGAIRLEVQKLWTDLASAREKVLVQDRRLEAARRWRDQFGLSVQTAGADISKGIDPLKAYFEAQVAWYQAHYEYLIAEAALAKGLGVSELPNE